MRGECLRDMGGLANDYFLYYEDVDLCRRARARGWSVWYEPALQVVHHHPLHDRPVPPRLRVITRHALLTYARRHWPTWQLRLLAGIVRVEARVRKWLAWCQGDSEAAACFGELGGLAAEIAGGKSARARRRLLRLVRQAEAAGVT
jgi:hypothetical protein